MTQKVAFVSGSGRGIGRAIAIALAESGYAVGVGDLREPEGNETVDLIVKGGRESVVCTPRCGEQRFGAGGGWSRCC